MDIYREFIFQGKPVALQPEYAELVKKAQATKVLSDREYNNLPHSEFALDTEKIVMFPMHDEAHAITSLAMLEKNASKLTPAAFYYAMDKLSKQAALRGWHEVYKKASKWAGLAKEAWLKEDSVWDVGNEKIARKLTYQEKKALPDSAFAFVKTINGKKVRKYPLIDAEHVRAAMTYFGSNYTYLPPGDRQEVARKIIRAAKREGIEVDPDSTVARIAGLKKAAHFIGDVEPPIEMEKPFDLSDKVRTAISINKFASEFYKYDPKVKREVAKEIVKAATFFKIASLPKEVKVAASNTVNPKIAEALESRFKIYMDRDLVQQLRLLQKAASKNILDPEKILEELTILDKKANVTGMWGTAIPDPIEVVYAADL